MGKHKHELLNIGMI